MLSRELDLAVVRMRTIGIRADLEYWPPDEVSELLQGSSLVTRCYR
jgi:hypothetical protein